MRKALITGITGQDGSYLAELLLEKGYQVHGIIRRASTFNTERLEGIYQDPHSIKTNLFLHYGDMTDGDSLRNIIRDVMPDEIYNLAAMSHVRVSFDTPIYTHEVNALGSLRLFCAVKDICPKARVYQASTSEMFGSAPPVQTLETPFQPQSPYAVSKLAAHNYAKLYREAYGLHISCGILFNHGSIRRGETFVERKITRAAGRIKLGLQDTLYLGNLDAKRDWGDSRDFVRGMYLMLQQEKPDDYILATGETWTIRQLLDIAFWELDLDWTKYVAIDDKYKRPAEVNALCGDYSKAFKILGWQPDVTFKEMIKRMVAHDLKLAERELIILDKERTK